METWEESPKLLKAATHRSTWAWWMRWTRKWNRWRQGRSASWARGRRRAGWSSRNLTSSFKTCKGLQDKNRLLSHLPDSLPLSNETWRDRLWERGLWLQICLSLPLLAVSFLRAVGKKKVSRLSRIQSTNGLTKLKLRSTRLKTKSTKEPTNRTSLPWSCDSKGMRKKPSELFPTWEESPKVQKSSPIVS